MEELKNVNSEEGQKVEEKESGASLESEKKEQTQSENSVTESAPEPKKAESKDVQENKMIALLSYISILFLIPLLAKKDSVFCQFHAKQGLVLFLGELVGWLLYPFLGLGFLVHLAVLVLAIMGIINVLGGEMKKLPLVGDFADKFNL
ncbi:MAG: hypothetical protein Athens071425_77 [Parcubacteria group bacterium Athens0714_25]|nr:MAG: hypothetical protein Athens071425_77 [Parcubacteria group bacterium Athens0714_25]